MRVKAVCVYGVCVCVREERERKERESLCMYDVCVVCVQGECAVCARDFVCVCVCVRCVRVYVCPCVKRERERERKTLHRTKFALLTSSVRNGPIMGTVEIFAH